MKPTISKSIGSLNESCKKNLADLARYTIVYLHGDSYAYDVLYDSIVTAENLYGFMTQEYLWDDDPKDFIVVNGKILNGFDYESRPYRSAENWVYQMIGLGVSKEDMETLFEEVLCFSQ